MKNIKRIFFGLVFVIAFYCLFAQAFLDLDGVEATGSFLIAKIFLYYKPFDEIFGGVAPSMIIAYFCMLLFGYLFISNSLYGTTRKYRSMVMLRYNDKNLFLQHYQIRAFLSTVIIIFSLFCASALAEWLLYPHSFELPVEYLLLFANLTLFYCTILTVNLFLMIRYDDAVALVILSVFIAIMVLIDVSFVPISFVTIGEPSALLIGCVLLFLFTACANIFLYYYIKSHDLL